MNIIAIAIACVVLAAGSYMGHTQSVEVENTLETDQVMGTTTDITPSLTSAITDIQDPSSTPTPTATPYLTPTVPVVSGKTFSSGYKYSPSMVVSETESKITLRSENNPEDITNWYKEKIRSEGMNIKTFVTTRANDKILNKLAGADSDRELYVEITKNPQDTETLITVSLTQK